MNENTVYVFSQAISAFITALGMVSDNQQALVRGDSIPYSEEAFIKVINDHGIGTNSVLKQLYGG